MTLNSMLVGDAFAFAVALVLSALLTPAIRSFAVSHRVFDRAGSARKVHTHAIPRLGGIAIVVAWVIAAGAILALQPGLRDVFWSNRTRTITFMIGALAATTLGMLDDVHGVRARYKLAVQLGIGALLCWAGFTVHELQLPGGIVLQLGPFAVLFTMLWIAGVMNAMNLIDGLDGLAGGLAAIALTAVLVFATAMGKPLLGVYTAALIGAVIGFLIYNFNPATIFMGDAGSLFLGYFLSVAGLVPARQPNWSRLELPIPLVILGLPIADTLLAF